MTKYVLPSRRRTSIARRVREQPVDDHLPVAHVVLLDLRSLADASQLNQRVACVVLVLGGDDVIVVLGRDDAQLDELRIGKEIQGDEVGAGFLDGGVLLSQELVRRLGHARRPSGPSRGRSPRASRS